MTSTTTYVRERSRRLRQITAMLLLLGPAILSLDALRWNDVPHGSGIAQVLAASDRARILPTAQREIWGNISRYSDDYIVLDRRAYAYAENVIIDVYSLQKNERGNTRIVLDLHGRVTHIFFYGIDMPEAIRRFKL